MKTTFLLFIFISLSIFSNAQSIADSVVMPLTREQKKAAKAAEQQLLFENTVALLNSKAYVLEAQFLSGRSGYRYIASSTLNFIRVDSTSIVLQIGSNNRLGYNGVGGVTVKGHITTYKLEINEKRKTFYLRLNLTCNSGAYDVFMDGNASGHTIATVTGIYPGSVTYDGQLVPLQESRVYEGQSY